MPLELFKIVVTSDLHAQLAFDPKAHRPGLARLGAYVFNLRKAGPVYLLDAGDLVSGSIYGAMDQGQTVAALFGRLGYAAWLPGNHDFDYAPETGDPRQYFNTLCPLARNFSPDLKIAALNLTYQGQVLEGSNAPLILSLDPLVAVLGVSCPLTHRPSLGPILGDFDFGLKESLRATKENLLSLLAAAIEPLPGGTIIVLSHLGAAARAYAGLSAQMDLDFPNAPTGPDLAGVKGVSLVVDGHSHEIVEPYRPRSGSGLYLNLGQGGESLAQVAVYADGSFNLKLVTFNDLKDLTPDPELEALTTDLTVSLGLNDHLLTLPPTAKYGLEGLWETIIPFGQLTVAAMAQKAHSQIAFLNKGSLRAGLEGQVTVASLYEALPFNDDLLSGEITGQVLEDFLRDRGRKGFKGFPLIHGLALWAYPEGDKVGLAGITLASGEEIKPEKTYSLALSGQMTRLLTNPKANYAFKGTLVAAILDFIRQKGAANNLEIKTAYPPYQLFSDQKTAYKAFAARVKS
ncbi:MAG: 5'-nucleotidase C-terminal domain-containing protein [Deltaproteobacteria bacterium]|jgi:2',3'-cyclic-nucleotide 2'-phosphodiesterase (5'-nucleotidase family)|nr:5'-nucleotidase C-terminal domain-containing protein [Deltaproteobacteria bacterium]